MLYLPVACADRLRTGREFNPLVPRTPPFALALLARLQRRPDLAPFLSLPLHLGARALRRRARARQRLVRQRLGPRDRGEVVHPQSLDRRDPTRLGGGRDHECRRVGFGHQGASGDSAKIGVDFGEGDGQAGRAAVIFFWRRRRRRPVGSGGRRRTGSARRRDGDAGRRRSCLSEGAVDQHHAVWEVMFWAGRSFRKPRLCDLVTEGPGARQYTNGGGGNDCDASPKYSSESFLS